jgi:hypothetical protein
MDPNSAISKNSFNLLFFRTGITNAAATTILLLLLLLLRCRWILQVSELILTPGFYGPNIFFLMDIFTWMYLLIPRIYIGVYRIKI